MSFPQENKRDRIILKNKLMWIQSYLHASVTAEKERLKKGRKSTSLSLSDFARQHHLDRFSLMRWHRQYYAGQFSPQFFDTTADYDEYMNGTRVLPISFFLQKINENLASKFRFLGAYLKVVEVEGPAGPYGLFTKKSITLATNEDVGEYKGGIGPSPKDTTYLCGFSMACNKPDGREIFVDAADFFSCYFRYVNHPPLNVDAHLYFSERRDKKIMVCVKEGMKITANAPVYLDYGCLYFLPETLHKNNRKRALFGAMCDASKRVAVVDKVDAEFA